MLIGAKPRGRPRKKAKLESNPELVAVGRVIAIMEDEDTQQLAFKVYNLYVQTAAQFYNILSSFLL